MAPHFVQYLVIFLRSPTGSQRRADEISAAHEIRACARKHEKFSDPGVQTNYRLLLMLIPTPMITQNST